MKINNYQTGEFIGNSTSINKADYEAQLSSNPTGAVTAGDWISAAELDSLGIEATTTIFAE